MENSYLKPSRKKLIRELAETIAAEYLQQECVNPEEIASQNDIKFHYGRYGHYFDGMLECKNGQFFIYCNLERVRDKNSPRARFTFCHELGHYFIDEHRNTLLSGQNLHHPSQSEYTSKNLVEQEADFFASHLLMPEFLFNQYIRRKKALIGIEEIFFLKGKFKSSITSTSIRYVEANVLSCAIFIWNIDGTLKWHWKSSEFEKQFICKPIENFRNLGKNTATFRAISSDSIQTGGGTVAAFFENVSTGDRRNAIIIEESLRLGEHGLLTFIYPENKKIIY